MGRFLREATMTGERYSVPIAEPVVESDEPDPTVETDLSAPILSPPGTTPLDPRRPWPPIPQPCQVDLPDGCYRLRYTPSAGEGVFRGTLRVDRGEGRLVISGDLYSFPLAQDQPDMASPEPGALVPGIPRRLGIPVYPRARYHSYLKATSTSLFSIKPPGRPCRGSITFEQYDYTQPPAGSFNGSFPAAPGSRSVTIRFAKRPAPISPWPGKYFHGEWLEAGVVTGTVVLGWVSSSFRKCTVEVDTLVDAVAPQQVPAPGGSGTESFRTMLASAGWAARVVYDQVDIPVPAGVPDHRDCWTDGNLHALMSAVRKSTTNLDAQWRTHVLVVPGRIPCSRGKMYDSIDVPREGVVSYSDDGYPASHSAFFGTAQDQMQRDVPRAFLRSASHEVVHGFNQIHQEQEGGADNSIMTTTPSVADVLGTATR
jgi:hypothetical protein